MKHIKTLSKVNPKAALNVNLSKGAKSPCDTFLKTPEEKDAKKNATS